MSDWEGKGRKDYLIHVYGRRLMRRCVPTSNTTKRERETGAKFQTKKQTNNRVSTHPPTHRERNCCPSGDVLLRCQKTKPEATRLLIVSSTLWWRAGGCVLVWVCVGVCGWGGISKWSGPLLYCVHYFGYVSLPLFLSLSQVRAENPNKKTHVSAYLIYPPTLARTTRRG